VRLLTLATGRRSRYLVALVFVLVAGGLSAKAGELESVQKRDLAEFLPGGAESVAALHASRAFPSGEVSPAMVVVARDRGLADADLRALERLRGLDLPLAAPEVPAPQRSADGTAALLAVPLRGEDSGVVADAVETLRGELDRIAPDGLETAVTGPAGFSTDLRNVFSGADTRLLAITAALVLVLLILIYRSPVFWLVPMFTVLLTEGATRGLAALLGQAGLTINGANGGVLSVLVFGAATDYALLLVARYREELTRHEDPGTAMAIALRGAAPAILASGATVIAGLLTLLVADVDSSASIGPLGAAGIAVALVLSLTVLPATLVIVGRRAFWPLIPRYGQDTSGDHRAWRRLGARIAARPRPLWIGSALALAVLALGLAGLDTSLTQEDQLRGEPEAVQGQRLLARAFPAGTSAPASVIVPPGGDVDAVERAIARLPDDVAAGIQRAERGAPGTQLSVVLGTDPFSEAALEAIPRLRAAVHEAEPRALVGGQAAQAYDLREAAERDNLVIPPLTLGVVLLVLVVLLRALVAPLLVLLATALSAAAALGASVVVFDAVLGLPAVDPTLPLLAFVFLVALGVDYTIFLMARAREEAERQGTRRGVLAALAVTGGVITSAGVVLAGTFSALAVLPLVVLTQLGTAVALGVLLDTLLVRSVLVPALVHDLGDRAWAPSALARRDTADGDGDSEGDGDAGRALRPLAETR
jgi:RND superfamily putative drug exporter